MRNEQYLAPRPVNHQPLTPVSFLKHAAESFPDRLAVVADDGTFSYRGLAALVARMQKWLKKAGVAAGDVVSVMASNRPEMLAAHYAVPGIGAVLNTINTRLDADAIRYILRHSESRMLLADKACFDVASNASQGTQATVVRLGRDDDVLGLYQGTLSDADALECVVADEWQALCVNYTSGTTGNPKGVVYHHRGAYLNALGNVMALGFDRHTVYLWTLPMFHCNGWCHTWAVTAAGGVHVCLERVDPALVFAAIERHGVTHLACAPVVLYMMLNHEARSLRDASRRIVVGTGGASPTPALIEQLDALGMDIVHLYGLTETYGPVTLRTLPDELVRAPTADRATYLSRQGVSHPTAAVVRVVADGGADVPADGQTVGEILLSGNTLMAGYLKDEDATARAFAGGWFHTGDLAVRHPDGAVEIKDRLKDIIISGGENISSLEIESVLHQHPSVLLAAIVAAADPKWGEVPFAFIELKPGAAVTPEALTAFCRERLAGFKVPRRFAFRELPKTATGKIQKFLLREEARATSPAPAAIGVRMDNAHQ